jgi:hypothetical protein
MTSISYEIRQLLKYSAASRTLHNWLANVEAVALLNAAFESGIIAALHPASRIQQIAKVTGLDEERIEAILRALVTHDLIKKRNGVFYMAPGLEVLTSPNSP